MNIANSDTVIRQGTRIKYGTVMCEMYEWGGGKCCFKFWKRGSFVAAQNRLKYSISGYFIIYMNERRRKYGKHTANVTLKNNNRRYELWGGGKFCFKFWKRGSFVAAQNLLKYSISGYFIIYMNERRRKYGKHTANVTLKNNNRRYELWKL